MKDYDELLHDRMRTDLAREFFSKVSAVRAISMIFAGDTKLASSVLRSEGNTTGVSRRSEDRSLYNYHSPSSQKYEISSLEFFVKLRIVHVVTDECTKSTCFLYGLDYMSTRPLVRASITFVFSDIATAMSIA